MGLLDDSFDINVTTQPMADKMSEVAHQVGKTTAGIGKIKNNKNNQAFSLNILNKK